MEYTIEFLNFHLRPIFNRKLINRIYWFLTTAAVGQTLERHAVRYGMARRECACVQRNLAWKNLTPEPDPDLALTVLDSDPDPQHCE